MKVTNRMKGIIWEMRESDMEVRYNVNGKPVDVKPTPVEMCPRCGDPLIHICKTPKQPEEKDVVLTPCSGNQAELLGTMAYAEGRDVGFNPYEPSDHRNSYWLSGWRVAEQMQRMADK